MVNIDIFRRRSTPMKKTFLAAALVASLCVPAYAAQYTNQGDNRFDSPDIVAEPNHAVQSKGEEQKAALPITLTVLAVIFMPVVTWWSSKGTKPCIPALWKAT